MRKLICLVLGHKWERLLFTKICARCAKADILDETMDQFLPNWRERWRRRGHENRNSVFVLIAVALAIYGKYASDHDTNPDNVQGAIPMLMAIVCFGIAVVLTVGWGLFRPFTS